MRRLNKIRSSRLNLLSITFRIMTGSVVLRVVVVVVEVVIVVAVVVVGGGFVLGASFIRLARAGTERNKTGYKRFQYKKMLRE